MLQSYIQNLVNKVGTKKGKTGTINAQNLGTELDDLVYPQGTKTINTNGEYNISTYLKAYIDVKGKPYELSGSAMDAFLGNPLSDIGDIVLNTDNNKYYKIVSDGVGTEPYYEELKGDGIVPEGIIDINSNGSHDVTNYAIAKVSIKGEPHILQGEDFDRALVDGSLKVDDVVYYIDDGMYYKVVSNNGALAYELISGEEIDNWDGSYSEIGNTILPPVDDGAGGIPIEVSSSEEMDTLLVAENIGKIYKYVGETTENYTNGALYQISEEV